MPINTDGTLSSRSNSATIGIDPPSRTKTALRPKARCIARLAACMAGWSADASGKYGNN